MINFDGKALTPAAFCARAAACDEGTNFAVRFETMSEVWDNCQNPSWLLFMLDAIRYDAPEERRALEAREIRKFMLNVWQQPRDAMPGFNECPTLMQAYTLLGELQKAQEELHPRYRDELVRFTVYANLDTLVLTPGHCPESLNSSAVLWQSWKPHFRPLYAWLDGMRAAASGNPYEASQIVLRRVLHVRQFLWASQSTENLQSLHQAMLAGESLPDPLVQMELEYSKQLHSAIPNPFN